MKRLQTSTLISLWVIPAFVGGSLKIIEKFATFADFLLGFALGISIVLIFRFYTEIKHSFNKRNINA